MWNCVVSLLCITFHTQPTVQPLLPPAIEVPDETKEAERSDDPATMSDVDALNTVKIDPNDANALLDYIRIRTLNDIDLTSISKVIAQPGDDNFDTRLAAQQRLINFGPTAAGPLHKVLSDAKTDPEIAYRARKCLAEMEQIPHERVAVAVVRRLAEMRPPTTAKVLLDYLPLVNDRGIHAQIRSTLAIIARSTTPTEPAIIDALDAKRNETRLAAALSLIQRDILKDQPALHKTILATAKREADSSAQFQMLFALAHEVKDPAAIEQMLRILPNVERGRLWQAEDLLLQLAGDQAPKATFGDNKQSVQDAATVWQRWWQAQRANLDLARFEYKPRTTGRMLLSLMDTRYGGPGKLLELDPDLKVAWEIDGLSLPTDMLTLPDGTVAVAEANAARVTIRNPQGDILRTISLAAGNVQLLGNPQKLQLLDNGNLLVVCRNQVLEFKKGTDEIVQSYLPPVQNIASALRLRNGETMIINQQQGTDYCSFLDQEGHLIKDRTLKIAKPYYQADMDQTPSGNVLLTELNQLAEYDLKTGELVWHMNAPRPTNVQRLFNGNTLYVAGATGQIIELDPEGKTVWTYKSSDEKQVYRARRQ